MSLPPPHVSPFRTDILAGQVALITGGGSGIGLEITRQLGLHGASVAISGRRQQVLDGAVAALQEEGISAIGLQGDVRKAADCERWVQETTARFGRLDILVNCAAGNFLASAEELSVNGFRTVMEIDTIGTFATSRAAFPALRARGGSIINISATLHYGATWWQAHASAAKAAVDSLTRSLAVEWGEFGVRVNGIAPGPTGGTAGVQKLAGVDASEEEVNELVASTIPIGRVGSKWDIAIAAVFLCSSAARHITGDTLVVDGAAWMWRQPVVSREMVSKASRGVEAKSRAVGLSAAGQRSKL
ncbi:Peroxisomal 2,4-dienoyl-CoA reductase [Coccomyxa sp. Obi]|nr:Peroxisomal 2,4-dienoyl-CoA reductase [Coccomyxa sp. Obi]